MFTLILQSIKKLSNYLVALFSDTNKTTWSDLPLECQQHIVGYLPLETLSKFALVSQDSQSLVWRPFIWRATHYRPDKNTLYKISYHSLHRLKNMNATELMSLYLTNKYSLEAQILLKTEFLLKKLENIKIIRICVENPDIAESILGYGSISNKLIGEDLVKLSFNQTELMHTILKSEVLRDKVIDLFLRETYLPKYIDYEDTILARDEQNLIIIEPDMKPMESSDPNDREKSLLRFIVYTYGYSPENIHPLLIANEKFYRTVLGEEDFHWMWYSFLYFKPNSFVYLKQKSPDLLRNMLEFMQTENDTTNKKDMEEVLTGLKEHYQSLSAPASEAIKAIDDYLEEEKRHKLTL